MSVIIPAYNAQRWVRHAIQSVLDQTYPYIEIIVVDDGSNDDTASTVRRLRSDQVTLLSQTNSGGSAARNLGIHASNGEFLQFLDADDEISPEKISRQVEALRRHSADVVYGDWRYLTHEHDGTVIKGDVQHSGHQRDVLVSLLSGWWVANGAILFRRSVVQLAGGWNEELRAAQDRDFFTRIALKTSRIVYCPGCETIYRRWSSETVSTKSRDNFLWSHLKVTRDLEIALRRQNRFSSDIISALATQYFTLAQNFSRVDQEAASSIARHIRVMMPAFVPRKRAAYRTIYVLFGFQTAEFAARVVGWIRHLTMALHNLNKVIFR